MHTHPLAGFTLVEIMVVIAIVMILASAAVLQTSQVQNLLQFNNTFSRLTLMVQRARNLASTETEAGTDFGVYMEGTDLFTGQQKITLFANRITNPGGNERYDPLAAGDPPGARDEKLENALVLPAGIQVTGFNFQDGQKCTTQTLIFFESGTGNATFYCNDTKMDRSAIDPTKNQSGQLQIGLNQNATSRQKCFVIHVLSGIPQIETCEKM